MKFAHVAAGTAALGLLAGTSVGVRADSLPWGQSSDMIAWETFVQVTAPSGNPQATNVEFETWASDQDIYAKSPPQWPLVGAPKVLQISALGTGHLQHGVTPQVITPDQCVIQYDTAAAAAAGFPAGGCIGEEVRRNWSSFQYIVSNNLFSRAGLAQAYAKGLKVDLPADAIEVKGDWVKVTDLMAWLNLDSTQVHQMYYTNKASDGATTAEFALVAFHFSTKQQKNWVWADFEHHLNPGRCDYIGCHDNFGATTANVFPNPQTNQSYGECKKTPALQAMLGNGGVSPVWQNYCLKGSQIFFTGADGQPTILGNSVIEQINAGVPVTQSSCITCHAYASFDNAGRANGAFGENLVGPLDSQKLQGYLTNDFLWGNLLAK